MGFSRHRKAKAGFKRADTRAGRYGTRADVDADYEDYEDYEDYDDYEDGDYDEGGDYNEEADYDEDYDDDGEYKEHEQSDAADQEKVKDSRDKANDESAEGHTSKSGEQAAVAVKDTRSAPRAEGYQPDFPAKQAILPEHIERRLAEMTPGLGISFAPAVQQGRLPDNSPAVATPVQNAATTHESSRAGKAEQPTSSDANASPAAPAKRTAAIRKARHRNH